MATWSYCAICGRAIPLGELCYGIKNWKGDPEGGETICKDCLVPENSPTLTQPNEPLTLEELSLCNDPVWIRRIGDGDLSGDGWAIVEGPRCLTWHNRIPVSWEILVWWPGSEVEDCPKYENYGKTWLAYRRPKEGEEET